MVLIKIIPLLSAYLYMLGGQKNKWFRWLLGLPISLIALLNHNYIGLLCIVTYLIATNALSYGDNMWTTKLFGKWVSMGISGFAFGLASMCFMGVFWGYLQAIVACCSFLLIKKWDDAGLIDAPKAELLRGGLGTMLYLIAGV